MTNDTPRYQGDDDETEEVTIVLTGKEGWGVWKRHGVFFWVFKCVFFFQSKT